MSKPIESLRAEIGFKLDPLLADIDGGAAFAGFLSFAFGRSKEASILQNRWADADGIEAKPEGSKASKEDAARYVDWLISNVWGEASKPTEVEA